MPTSMTAFARQQSQGEWGTLTCEIRSVNHRYLEMFFRLPEPLRECEMTMREQLREALGRGKVECTFRHQANEQLATDFSLNEVMLEKVLRTAEKVGAKISADPADVDALRVMQWPGVLEKADEDYSALQKATLALFKATIKDLIDARQREGDKLKELVCQRLDKMDVEVAKVKQAMPELVAAQNKRLRNTFEELKLDLDSGRLEQEMAVLAQKADVTEELDRLVTHINEERHILSGKGAIGRRLDFLMQELNREANTLSSKSIDTSVTNSAIELKVLIEQMREQIQNIE